MPFGIPSNVPSLVFHTITPLESTGLEHWKVFQMEKLGGKEEKKFVGWVANRGSFNRNYWGSIRIPGSCRLGGTDKMWVWVDKLGDTPLESNP